MTNNLQNLLNKKLYSPLLSEKSKLITLSVSFHKWNKTCTALGVSRSYYYFQCKNGRAGTVSAVLLSKLWDGKIWSFGSILRQIRVHCSGCSNPADESIGLTTQPLYQGTWKAGKWTKKSRSIAQCHEIDSHHQPRLGDQWRIFSYVFLFAILICPFLCQFILMWQLAIDGVYRSLLQKYR